MKDGRGAEPLVRNVVADFLLPENFAIARESGGVDGAVVEEIGVKLIAIASDGGRCGGGIVVMAFISTLGVDFFLPDEFAGRAIKTNNRLRPARFICGGEENLVSNNGRRTVATTGDWCLPCNIFSFAPVDWWILARSCDAVTRRSAPCRPVVARINCSGQRREAGKEQNAYGARATAGWKGNHAREFGDSG